MRRADEILRAQLHREVAHDARILEHRADHDVLCLLAGGRRTRVMVAGEFQVQIAPAAASRVAIARSRRRTMRWAFTSSPISAGGRLWVFGDTSGSFVSESDRQRASFETAVGRATRPVVAGARLHQASEHLPQIGCRGRG